MTTWTDKQKREDTRVAALELAVSLAAGMTKRGGDKLTLNDFLPAYCKPKPKELTDEETEALLIAQFIDPKSRP